MKVTHRVLTAALGAVVQILDLTPALGSHGSQAQPSNALCRVTLLHKRRAISVHRCAGAASLLQPRLPIQHHREGRILLLLRHQEQEPLPVG
jgi:hypothetical protein